MNFEPELASSSSAEDVNVFAVTKLDCVKKQTFRGDSK